MLRYRLLFLTLGVLAVTSLAMHVRAGDTPPGPPPQGGDQGAPGAGPGGQADQQGPPPRHGPGFHLIPRFAEEKMNLTDDQKKQIADLEKETKAKLAKILTPEQMKTLETSHPPRPPQDGGQGGQGAGQNGGPGGGQGGGQDGPPGGGPGGPPQN